MCNICSRFYYYSSVTSPIHFSTSVSPLYLTCQYSCIAFSLFLFLCCFVVVCPFPFFLFAVSFSFLHLCCTSPLISHFSPSFSSLHRSSRLVTCLHLSLLQDHVTISTCLSLFLPPPHLSFFHTFIILSFSMHLHHFFTRPLSHHIHGLIRHIQRCDLKAILTNIYNYIFIPLL